MPTYSLFFLSHIIVAIVAIPLLCYSLYKLYRSVSFNTKCTLAHIYVTSLLILGTSLPTSIVYGDDLLAIIPPESILCTVQAHVFSVLLAPYLLLPVLLSFITYNAIRKNQSSFESSCVKRAALIIWGFGVVILIGNILIWWQSSPTYEASHEYVSLFYGIQVRGWVCKAHYTNNLFTHLVDAVFCLTLLIGLVLSVMSFAKIFSLWRRQIRRHAIGFRYSIYITLATFLFTATHLPVTFFSDLAFAINPNEPIASYSFMMFSSCEILLGIYSFLILGNTYSLASSQDTSGEEDDVLGKDEAECGSIAVSELRFRYFV